MDMVLGGQADGERSIWLSVLVFDRVENKLFSYMIQPINSVCVDKWATCKLRFRFRIGFCSF